MPLSVLLNVVPLEYEPQEIEKWRAGDRPGGLAPYFRSLRNAEGFGEYVIGRYFQERGYQWIHHDFDIFGTNIKRKYSKSEDVLVAHFGQDRLDAVRELYRSYIPFRDANKTPMEQPDLLIYRPDSREIRFAESKLESTRDKLRHQQVLGLYLIGAVLRCPVDVFLVRPNDSKKPIPTSYEFRYGP